MLKVLLKKQLLEINRSIFFNQKTGDRRSKGAIAVFIGLFAVLLLFLMAMFGFAAYALATIFIPQRLSWFYFFLRRRVVDFIRGFRQRFQHLRNALLS